MSSTHRAPRNSVGSAHHRFGHNATSTWGLTTEGKRVGSRLPAVSAYSADDEADEAMGRRETSEQRLAGCTTEASAWRWQLNHRRRPQIRGPQVHVSCQLRIWSGFLSLMPESNEVRKRHHDPENMLVLTTKSKAVIKHSYYEHLVVTRTTVQILRVV